MGKIKKVLGTAFLGGVVYLPAVLVVVFFWWVYGNVSEIVHPLALLVGERFGTSQSFSNALTIIAAFLFFLLTGFVVKTRIGRAVKEAHEKVLQKVIPFYSHIKWVVGQLLDREGKHIFSVPVKVIVRGTDGAIRFSLNGFITDESHENTEMVTVFIPTVPNPTTGIAVDLPKGIVFRVDIGTKEAMKVIFSCGGGSLALLEKVIARDSQ
ncbi:MAG: hypothetical protein A3D67_02300 [Candidatus Lloydbacteria bacterium RIFCSPHIGHO2_02_FULL_51_22]|uniref:DUF502 domain-containing protein n=3 Tax=Candidatus Lloydiibacteriota TaxID=1817910 RepID=A0A1G2DAM0_9BACT|nr:MAG: hypothetical protein A3D67_02300 [Candidatus Lloydbacteria bacterium RIFCSPHIGHO2_02_FULL_51_22]OGZ14056.1 MAG: hypothetical protein A3J08_03980 [Candidatus Lloydbacteria bacterium RIFCSPLOWO2_02_FULL_51_11]OGZ17288.1 MAG: hypothetical protein A3G11_01805 [Candidatus Lloydbacteria bacterium RIFCSPLOWO2_12_FULL_51_9]